VQKASEAKEDYIDVIKHLCPHPNDQEIQQQERQDAEDWRQGSAQLQVSMLRRLDVSASL
jgi:hypothetical protein